ncbi:Ppx/GppA phosphatase family protein [Pectinatus sottacetonis]|uniref:Ppx/GppA phosphatase family protein n=1 Tax=Pectinatus sottacetonis TaxID=1002795 RepID=UPI0018C76D9D|nr:exopolyphosphatase [Pectinatus sottacetonis]
MLYALIDIGSSTIRMAIYNINYGRIEMLMKKKHTVGLAAYVKDGVMQQKGIDKTCEILNEFNDFLAGFHIVNVAAFTTAAIRNVKNSQDVIEQLKKRTKIAIRIITGEEEAEFDFAGVIRSVDMPAGIMIDVGGGSTEIIHYENEKIIKKSSIPVGALSLYTKYVEDFLPSYVEIEDMQKEVEQLLAANSNFGNFSKPYMCGIGGTIKSTRLLYNELFNCAADNMKMDTSRFINIIKKYTCADNLDEAAAIILLRTAPDRLKTIIPGLVIVDKVCQFFKAAKLKYIDTGMREGFIYKQIIDKK